MGEALGKVRITPEARTTIQTQMGAFAELLRKMSDGMATTDQILDPGLHLCGQTPDGDRALHMIRSLLVDGPHNWKQTLSDMADAAEKLNEIAQKGFDDLTDQDDENLLAIGKTFAPYPVLDLGKNKGAAS